jgi:hypothetical protein
MKFPKNTKVKHNPIKLINQFWHTASTKHIIYEPSLKKAEYNIIRESGGDGTYLFTFQMLQSVLIDIVNGTSFFKNTEPDDWSKIKNIEYTIGDIRHVTVFGMIYLKISSTHKYPGQRERARIPVKCKYIY